MLSFLNRWCGLLPRKAYADLLFETLDIMSNNNCNSLCVKEGQAIKVHCFKIIYLIYFNQLLVSNKRIPKHMFWKKVKKTYLEIFR